MRFGFLFFAFLLFFATHAFVPSQSLAQNASDVGNASDAGNSLIAQNSPRVGLMFGRMYSSTEYFMFGGPAQVEDELAGVMGISVEQPLTTMLSLCLQAQLTSYGSGALFFSHQESGTANYYMAFINQRWMVELPLLLKASFTAGRLRPSIGAGPMLAVATPPERISINRSGTDGWTWVDYDLPGYHAGFALSIGTEFAVSDNVALSLDGVMTQLFESPLEIPELRQSNTPRFQVRFGIVFPTTAEEWK